LAGRSSKDSRSRWARPPCRSRTSGSVGKARQGRTRLESEPPTPNSQVVWLLGVGGWELTPVRHKEVVTRDRRDACRSRTRRVPRIPSWNTGQAHGSTGVRGPSHAGRLALSPACRISLTTGSSGFGERDSSVPLRIGASGASVGRSASGGAAPRMCAGPRARTPRGLPPRCPTPKTSAASSPSGACTTRGLRRGRPRRSPCIRASFGEPRPRSLAGIHCATSRQLSR
jgi:hypothetical protein